MPPYSFLSELLVVEDTQEVYKVVICNDTEWGIHQLIAEILGAGVVVAPIELDGAILGDVELHTHIAPHTGQVVAHIVNLIQFRIIPKIGNRVHQKEGLDIGKWFKPTKHTVACGNVTTQLELRVAFDLSIVPLLHTEHILQTSTTTHRKAEFVDAVGVDDVEVVDHRAAAGLLI